MNQSAQSLLFPESFQMPVVRDHVSSTFTDNMKLPVHRWFRFSAGFSATWVESVIQEAKHHGPARVFEPFAGCGTTLLAAENTGVEAYGVEAHPFLARIAKAKLAHRSDPEQYRHFVQRVRRHAVKCTASLTDYPLLIRRCYSDGALAQLDALRQSINKFSDGSLASEISWLTLVGILRKVSRAGTAPWQYVLPRKSKKYVPAPFVAFDEFSEIIYNDMRLSTELSGPQANLLIGDARKCDGIPSHFANLVVTSPPYPNNYDYADATRLEMTFLGEIGGWGDLQATVRQYLVRACSQHVPESAVNLNEILSNKALVPIHTELAEVCNKLATVRLTKGGKKTYHLMIACYFLDLALVFYALRRVCDSPSRVCFVIGDSAPYGVYVNVIEWLGRLAIAAGFNDFNFEKTRERNVKWKNRKHRVPLCEGRLWIEG